MTLCGGRVFPCKPTTALFQASETSNLAPIPCCNSEHLWWAPLHHMGCLCLSRACDRLDSTLLRLLLQFRLLLCVSLLWFKRSLCLLMKYDTPVRETTEYLIFRALTCPKEYTFKSTAERWLPEDEKSHPGMKLNDLEIQIKFSCLLFSLDITDILGLHFLCA